MALKQSQIELIQKSFADLQENPKRRRSSFTRHSLPVRPR